MRRQIERVLKLGYTYDEVSSVLAGLDIHISGSRLKYLLGEVRKSTRSRNLKKAPELGETKLLRTEIHTTQMMITGVGKKIQELTSQISQNKLNLIELLGKGGAAWSYRLKVLGVFAAILLMTCFFVNGVVKGAVAQALESTTVVLPADVLKKLAACE